MRLTKEHHAAINSAISKISFAADATTVLTAQDRCNRVEKVMQGLVKDVVSTGRVLYVCPSCKSREYLLSNHETPMHRHGRELYLLRPEGDA